MIVQYLKNVDGDALYYLQLNYGKMRLGRQESTSSDVDGIYE